MTEEIRDQIELRRVKLNRLREEGFSYPNAFEPTHRAADLHDKFQSAEKDDLADLTVSVAVAGRMMTRRLMGKASFMNCQDLSGVIQVYFRRDDLPEGQYESFKQTDLGDIMGIKGTLFRTRTGELSIHATEFVLLSKSLHPLPEKYHGLSDHELCHRQRYLDLMTNEETRKRFRVRSQIVSFIRRFLEADDFLEVETPMMQVLAGGAAARPFQTHHNALDIPLFLRVAPELYLKRLVVGGFERVFEINRNFRNEGVSTRHNPEFTMLEFYQSHATYQTLIDKTQDLFQSLAQEVLGRSDFEYQGHLISFKAPFTCQTMEESLKEHMNLSDNEVTDLTALKALCQKHEIVVGESAGKGALQLALFEEFVEEKLIQPTFITGYPREVSPLARVSDHDPELTDRFELFIAGLEVANGFSELNDPDDQRQRFELQMAQKAQGDQEAMPYDHDYVEALEYGLPPTAGEGIGIDRLVMLMTNAPSIRDVILFPLMRPKSQSDTKTNDA